jgi:hypothetical protein
MSNNTVLQIPISKSLRDQAQAQVLEAGFSSLQDYLRLHLTQLKNNIIRLSFEPKPVKLSAKAAARYDKMTRDYLAGKVKTKTFNNTDELMDYLNR